MAIDGVIHSKGQRRFTASEAIGANLLVTLHTVAEQVALCGASGNPVAVAYDAIASGAAGDVQLLAKGDRAFVKCSAAIAIGDFVKAAAAGKVAPEAGTTTLTAFTIGQAETATSTDGDAFWMTVK